jgi:hypothetical protein
MILPNLDRCVAGHDYPSPHSRKPSTDEAHKHRPAEAVAVCKQLLSGAMRAVGEQFQRATLFRAEAAFSRG